MGCIVIPGDAWLVLLSPCNTIMGQERLVGVKTQGADAETGSRRKVLLFAGSTIMQ